MAKISWVSCARYGTVKAYICQHGKPACGVQLPAPTDLCRLPPDDMGWLSKTMCDQLVAQPAHVVYCPRAARSAWCLVHALVLLQPTSATMTSLPAGLSYLHRLTSAIHLPMRRAG